MRIATDQTVRRSVALPKSLIDEVAKAAPPEWKSNLNRIVITALKDFVRAKQRQEFEDAMARMAADPAVQAENAAIAREFSVADADGLQDEMVKRSSRRPRKK
jgi:hypothetical protein